MSKQCKNCGTDLPEDASFCPRCAQSQIERREVKPPHLWRKKALIAVGCALVLAAAMEGITEVTPLQAPLDDSGSLPESLEEAISLAEKSAFIREVLPENVIEAYLAEKKKTAARFEADANAVFQQHLRTI